MAVKPLASAPLAKEGPGWTALSAMEEEHLKTRASVPYRDPEGVDEAEIIQQRRELEQQCCELESTSAWQRRWLMRLYTGLQRCVAQSIVDGLGISACWGQEVVE